MRETEDEEEDVAEFLLNGAFTFLKGDEEDKGEGDKGEKEQRAGQYHDPLFISSTILLADD